MKLLTFYPEHPTTPELTDLGVVGFIYTTTFPPFRVVGYVSYLPPCWWGFRVVGCVSYLPQWWLYAEQAQYHAVHGVDTRRHSGQQAIVQTAVP